MKTPEKSLTKPVIPDKPYPAFPLFAHQNGQWCRKVSGKLHYFGPWADWKAALERHNKEYPYLKAGMVPPESYDGIKVGELCNRFRTAKKFRLDSGEIDERWYQDIKRACDLLLEVIDKDRVAEALTPADFEKIRNRLVKGNSPTYAKNNINRIRSIFRFAENNDLVDRKIRFGTNFRPPSKAVIRKYRNTKPKKLFSPEDIRKMVKAGDTNLSAMVLLAINAGLNNTDICQFRISCVDWKAGWVDYPRGKTGVHRRFKLWPETLKHLQASLKKRLQPHDKAHSDIFFITTFGNPWHPRNSLAKQFSKLRDDCKISGSFEFFRHTFETIAGGTKDQVAVNHVMGHVDNTMSAEYREGIDDERLEVVTEFVRTWLFG